MFLRFYQFSLLSLSQILFLYAESYGNAQVVLEGYSFSLSPRGAHLEFGLLASSDAGLCYVLGFY